MNEASVLFKAALRAGDLAALRKIPKADLHNHFMLGGDREWIAERWDVRIEAIQAPLQSMAEMDQWSQVSINTPFPDRTGRLRLLEATLHQAVKDGVSVLEIGEDVWALKHFYHGDVENLLASWKAVQEAAAPQIELRFADRDLASLRRSLSDGKKSGAVLGPAGVLFAGFRECADADDGQLVFDGGAAAVHGKRCLGEGRAAGGSVDPQQDRIV